MIYFPWRCRMFRNMEYVYAVYKEMSFSRAAEKLFISQPALSAMVKKVEKRIGSPIFDRSCSPIRLTNCGKEYISCIEQIMDVEYQFSQYLNQTEHLLIGSLSIGANSIFASFLLPSCMTGIRPFLSRHSRIYDRGEHGYIAGALNAGTLDIVWKTMICPRTCMTSTIYLRKISSWSSQAAAFRRHADRVINWMSRKPADPSIGTMCHACRCPAFHSFPFWRCVRATTPARALTGCVHGITCIRTSGWSWIS